MEGNTDTKLTITGADAILKVFKGKKMAGHMGDKLRTMQNIEIIKTDLENELLYLKGSIPGSKNAEVMVKKSVKNINKMKIGRASCRERV